MSSPTHAKIAGWIFAAVAGFVLAVTRELRYAVGVLLGPFAGAAARDWERHYVEVGLRFLPYALASFVVAVAVQLAVPTSTQAMRVARFLVWAFAVVSWFFFALLTYGEALE